MCIGIGNLLVVVSMLTIQIVKITTIPIQTRGLYSARFTKLR